MIVTSKARLVLINIFLLLLSSSLYAEKLQEEKEMETLNFDNIQSVLKQDGLTKALNSKKRKVQKMQLVRSQIEKSRFEYPNEDEMWGLVSELWLIKNAQVLGWDFDKPDYGLENAYKELLEKLGFIQRKFKILILNTPSYVRAALPGENGEVIHLISLPFIRSLDLSKLEISVFLLEDFFRLEAGYFKKSFKNEKLKEVAGKNFKGKKPDMSLVEDMLKHYSMQFHEKGFTFQQQFEITKKMDSYLKSMPDLWSVYYLLLGKMDRFLKMNLQYKDYLKLYPSPEMQVKWLSPEEKVL